MTYVLFDIGGTKTRVAVSKDLKQFAEPISFKTPKKFEEGIDAIVEAVKKMETGPITAAAGGVRGVLSEDRSEIMDDSALSAWVEEPLKENLKKKLKTEVYIENDSAVVALGEAHFGAGQGADIMVYHTVSTGVGGAKIEQGHIDSFSVGFEPGKQILDIDRTILGEDVLPTLENLVSGTALEARTGVKPYEIPQSDAVWDQLAYYLAHGLRNSVLYWSPDVIVLGGSMIVGDPRILLDDIIKHTQAVLGEEVPCPLLKDAELGSVGGLYGAMALLEQRT
ncbi:ROK family protein [Candidatus Kaiserbacteria bacterium]|nr:ROK family protein [Candidatus Kaiserbacteria bacterium]MCB9811803.1 ROK family protein [Candidatus Nomurabacteria bacterium]